MGNHKAELQTSPRSSISAMIWTDEQDRLRRLSYEASVNADYDNAMWHIVELSEFGVVIDRKRPVDVTS
jgi:hypothetical protein